MSVTPARSPWREPMLWLVVLLPFATVCAGVATLALALQNPADAAPADVRRTAQVQVEDLRADRNAAELRLEGELRIDAATGGLTLTLQSAQAVDDVQLTLEMLHPTRAADDQSQALAQAGSHWVGRLVPGPLHPWNLRLSSADGRWRLHGRMAAGALQARLVPSLMH